MALDVSIRGVDEEIGKPSAARCRNRMRYQTMVIVVLFSLSGCGSSDQPASGTTGDGSTPNTPSGAPTTTPGTTPDAATSDGATAGGDSEPGTGNPVLSIPPGDQANAAGSAGESSARVSSSVQQSSRATSPESNPLPEPPSPPPVPRPTEEQRARWAQPAREPLELLACRDTPTTDLISALACVSDGHHYVVAGKRVVIRSVDDEASEQVLLDLKESDQDTLVRSLAVAPNGQWLAAGDTEGMLRLWSLPGGEELRSAQIYDNDLTVIAVSPDSQSIATLSFGNEVTVLSAESPEQQQRFEVSTNGLRRIAWVSSNTIAAAGDATVLLNAENGAIVRTLSESHYHETIVRSSDARWFLYGDDEGLHRMNVTDLTVDATLAGEFAQLELADFSDDGRTVATANSTSVRIWDVATGKMVQEMTASGRPISGLGWLPETQILLVASETGTVRLWGTAAHGAALQLQPMHQLAELPAAKPGVPATTSQLLRAIDLRVFPRLPAAGPMYASEFSLSYSALADQSEVADFYRYFLNQSGWQELPATPSTAPTSARFRKQEMFLSTDFFPEDASKTHVSVTLAGNIDLRQVPRPGAGPLEVVYESENAVILRSRANIIDLEVSLLKAMHAAGWTAWSRLNSSHNEEPDQRNLDFIRNGSEIRVSIARFPADPSVYTISYAQSLTMNGLPIPPDSGLVEFDGSTQPRLVARTAMDPEQARAFYDNEMVAMGWLPRDAGRVVTAEQIWLPWIRGQQDVRIGLLRLESGGTLIRVGEELEHLSWQLSKDKAAEQPADGAAGIEAADFPILNASGKARYDVDLKSVEFQIDATPLLQAADQYSQQMEALGWKHDGRGIRESDYVFLTFEKDDREIQIRARLSDQNAIVNVQGDGILWAKPLPGGNQVIPYEAWLRRQKRPAGLQDLDTWESEMRAIAGGAPDPTP